MIKKIPKPFRDIIVPPARDVISPFDERDQILPVPVVKNISEKFFCALNFPVLDQKNSDFCTAFATFAGFAECLSGALRDEFRRIFTSENAFFIGSKQMNFSIMDFFRKILRIQIRAHAGRNIRAALWNFNHGTRVKTGDLLFLGEYFRATPESAEDLCKYLQFYGAMVGGLMLRGQNWFDENGKYVGRGPIDGGHAILLTGFNLRKKIFYFKNSWSENWGDAGFGTIPFQKFDDLFEVWILKKCRFQISE